jgi:hypothetical protein
MVIAFHITDLLVSAKREWTMKHFISPLVLVFVMGLPAAAEIKGCYERKYDAGVLARHPNQLVTYVVLRYGVPPNDQEGFLDDVTFRLRGGTAGQYSSYDCSGKKSKLTCKLTNSEGSDPVSGTFVLTEIKGGITLSPTSDLMLGNLDTQKPYTLDVMNNPEHQTFTLKKSNIDLESCGAQ